MEKYTQPVDMKISRVIFVAPLLTIILSTDQESIHNIQ